jgi:hypothetical protein
LRTAEPVAREFTDAELEAAVDALADRDRLREAEAVVARAAPQLQRILAQALEAGGWLTDAHDEAVRRALEPADATERGTAVRTLLAEEARMGMMVGVAVGWALAAELSAKE